MLQLNHIFFLFLAHRPTPNSTLFPYTTLFRSTIKLRPGVKFNDGTPMTAEAVKFSLDRHRELKGSTRASELANFTDRKSTRLNSSHQIISYAVFCLKKKKRNTRCVIILNDKYN